MLQHPLQDSRFEEKCQTVRSHLEPQEPHVYSRPLASCCTNHIESPDYRLLLVRVYKTEAVLVRRASLRRNGVGYLQEVHRSDTNAFTKIYITPSTVCFLLRLFPCQNEIEVTPKKSFNSSLRKVLRQTHEPDKL